MTDVSFLIYQIIIYFYYFKIVCSVYGYVYVNAGASGGERHQFSATGETGRCVPLDTGARSGFRFSGGAANPLTC